MSVWAASVCVEAQCGDQQHPVGPFGTDGRLPAQPDETQLRQVVHGAPRTGQVIARRLPAVMCAEHHAARVGVAELKDLLHDAPHHEAPAGGRSAGHAARFFFWRRRRSAAFRQVRQTRQPR